METTDRLHDERKLRKHKESYSSTRRHNPNKNNIPQPLSTMNTQSSLSPHQPIASSQSPPQPSPSIVYSSEEEITPRLPYKQSYPQNRSFSSSSYHPDTNLTRKRNASLDRSGSAKAKSPERSNFRPMRKMTLPTHLRMILPSRKLPEGVQPN
jgi:hypothetical protein